MIIPLSPEAGSSSEKPPSARHHQGSEEGRQEGLPHPLPSSFQQKTKDPLSVPLVHLSPAPVRLRVPSLRLPPYYHVVDVSRNGVTFGQLVPLSKNPLSSLLVAVDPKGPGMGRQRPEDLQP